jgi:chromosome segregation ATPase
MKKASTWFMLGLVTAVVAGFIYYRHLVRDITSELRGLQNDYNAYKSTVMENEKIAQSKINESLEIIDTLRGNIDSLMFENSNLEEEAERSEKRISELQKENQKLETKVEPVIQSNPALKSYVDNLKFQIDEYQKETLTLKAEIQTVKAAVLNYQSIVDEQEKVSTRYLALWQGEKQLRVKAEKLLTEKDRLILGLKSKHTLLKLGCGTGWVLALGVSALLLVAK